jgi:hypothetical protein
MKCEEYIDRLLVRKRDIVELFFDQVGLGIPTRKQDFREALVRAAQENMFDLTVLVEFLDDMASGGRRRFYFFDGLSPVNIQTAEQLDTYLEQEDFLHKQQTIDENDSLLECPPKLCHCSYKDGKPGFVCSEFDQARQAQSRIKELDYFDQHEDYGQIKFEASRVFAAPRTSFAYWQPIEGTMTLSIAQQEKAGDYKHVILDMQEQICRTVSVKIWQPRRLTNLIANVEKQPDIIRSQLRKNTSKGQLELMSNEASESLEDDETLLEAWTLASTVPTTKVRTSWSMKHHPCLSRDIVVFIDGFHDRYVSVRQDATASDMDYVLSRIRQLL